MQAMYPDILKAINDHGGASKSICITGHSLGGAMAIAFAYLTDKSGNSAINSLYTFGQPLLLNRSLAKHMNEAKFHWRYRRFVNGFRVTLRPQHHEGISRTSFRMPD